MNYKNYNDYELIYDVKENDYNSYNILFNKYLPVLKSLTYKYYKNYKNYGYDYDDFFQEASIAFSNAVEKYDAEKNALFYTFVTLCVNRSLLSFCRMISCHRKNISNCYLVNIDDCYICEESNIDNYFSYRGRIDIIKKAIYNMDIEESCILELKYNGFTYKEISTLLDISLRRAQFKGRKILKEIKNYLD